jgi:hypothetical protein
MKATSIQTGFARLAVVASALAGATGLAVGVMYAANTGNYWLATKWTAIGAYTAWTFAGTIFLILGWVLSGFAEDDRAGLPKEPWGALIWSSVRVLIAWVVAWLAADRAGDFVGDSSPVLFLWAARLVGGVVTYVVCWGLGFALTLVVGMGLALVQRRRE